MKYSSTKNKRIPIIYLSAFALVLLAMLLGLLLGSARVGLSDIFSIFSSESDSPEKRILLYVRIPRTLSALLCGAALALSGAVIQAVLANKLASPSIIGVNSGAGLAVTLAAALGIYGGWQISLFAFSGALCTVALVTLGAKKWGASRSTVILMGVALNSLLGAVSDTLITLEPTLGMINNDFKVGDFSASTYEKLLPATVLVAVSAILLFSLSNELEILTLGDDGAKGLGLNTSLFRILFLVLAAMLAGCAVSICGLLSFVGLLVPHAVRRIASNKAKHLLPLSALFGGGFVAVCDTLARTLFSPYEIPVGIIMAFLGAPFFIFILIKGKGGASRDKN